MRTTSVFLALLIPLLPTAARAASAAEPGKTFEALSERCRALTSEGDYPGALDACERAWTLKQEPWLLAYTAQIQTALLHPVQAREALVRYLRSGQLSEGNRKTAEAQVRYLDTLIATLVVATEVEGAEIRIDDQLMDTSALASGVQLTAGAHVVTLQNKGATFSRFVFLHAGKRAQVEMPGSGSLVLSSAIPHVRFFVDDKEVDAAQAARGVPAAAGRHRVTFKVGTSTSSGQTVLVNPDERVSVVSAEAAPHVAPTTMNPRGYWLMGAGLALGGAAIALGISNGYEYRRWEATNDSLRNDAESPDLLLAEQERRARENDQLMDSIQTKRSVAIGLGIAGGLVTAGGMALLFADSAAAKRTGSGSWLRRMAAGLSVDGAMSSGQIAWRSAW